MLQVVDSNCKIRGFIVRLLIFIHNGFLLIGKEAPKYSQCLDFKMRLSFMRPNYTAFTTMFTVCKSSQYLIRVSPVNI